MSGIEPTESTNDVDAWYTCPTQSVSVDSLFIGVRGACPRDYSVAVADVQRPSVSIDVLSPVDVAQIFQSLGEYIAIHEPILDEFGTLTDARLIWWNKGYEDVRVLPVSHLSKMSEAYFEPSIAIEYASTAWSSGRAMQLFEFTPAKRSRYRSPGPDVVISVLWERVGDFVVEVGSDLSELRMLETRLADQRSLVFASERDKALIAERERIARNLHDTVIQQIYASSLGLSAVASRLKELSTDSGDTVSRLQGIVSTIATDLSTLISTIRDEIFAVTQLPKNSLRQDLEDVILPIIGPSPMDLDLHVHLDQIDYPDIMAHLRAVIREAVSNAVRHSRGSRVTVAVHPTAEGRLHVVVADNGIGMPKEVSRSSGLTNIEERARALGGTARVLENGFDGGTVVSWQIPLPRWRQ